MSGVRRFFGNVFGGKFSYKSAGLLRWQLAAGLILAAEAAAVGLLSTGFNLPLYAVHLGTDALQTQLASHQVTSLAASELTRASFGFVVAAMLGLSALVFLLLVTLYRQRYIKMIEKGLQPWRWPVIAIAGVGMFSVEEVLVGVQDVATLGAVKACVVVGAILLLVLEQLLTQRNRQQSVIRLVTVAAIIVGLVPWLAMIGTIAADAVFGGVRAALYVWGLLATTFIGGVLILSNEFLAVKKLGKWATYAYSEYWFVLLVVLVESVFVWEVFAAILRP